MLLLRFIEVFYSRRHIHKLFGKRKDLAHAHTQVFIGSGLAGTPVGFQLFNKLLSIYVHGYL